MEADTLEKLTETVPCATSWDTAGFIRGLRAVAFALVERAEDWENEASDV